MVQRVWTTVGSDDPGPDPFWFVIMMRQVTLLGSLRPFWPAREAGSGSCRHFWKCQKSGTISERFIRFFVTIDLINWSLRHFAAITSTLWRSRDRGHPPADSFPTANPKNGRLSKGFGRNFFSSCVCICLRRPVQFECINVVACAQSTQASQEWQCCSTPWTSRFCRQRSARNNV
jgi:hypothetical protein